MRDGLVLRTSNEAAETSKEHGQAIQAADDRKCCSGAGGSRATLGQGFESSCQEWGFTPLGPEIPMGVSPMKILQGESAHLSENA